ncbi:hypothetical protein CathTA2_1477 [Caldalkalibacillus thermarum TA2.A1]|uniref:Iron-sulfur cluster biosynthesis family protein n=1 Tax=Caldalkalibacillus thermarum (strain TA2.A1) TaxID=986075 RepID=F5L6M7_CALTT|nr:iron-sulfur cluster biosynthesis family protein [Caldalkalibacillus thermarum]EGL82978.1 hypothetical protein CathTA2_1477 [Caldalkalibacillus thermarum TA2.A1]QZT34576.1 iron-sulfur cluster biosynthesis family protein [Caldalkalibacillus thermarum TA2.A1]GGK26769.1 hypothetical protein GCM10010965_19350 [Caldalkalibacillus thermarum]
MDIQLALDEPRPNDKIINVAHLTFFIDRFTQRYIGEKLTLDFDPAQGFRLSNPNEILCQGITIY